MDRKQRLLGELEKHPFILAPMAGITDSAFRTFMKRQGAGIVVSELVSATGLRYGSDRTKALLAFGEEERPVGLQLFGESAEELADGARYVEELGADFVDLNFGCPVPKVVKKGAGSAMLKDLKQLREVLRSVVKAVAIPVTIKIRTGWDAHTRNADEVVAIAAEEGITWVAIHGRTRAQGYEGLSDWDYIAEVKKKAGTYPVLGNGDIVTPKQAIHRLRESGCDGVLIGRGALKNPRILGQAMALLSNNSTSQKIPSSGELFRDLHLCLAARCDDRILQIQLKKFAAWFATGYPHAAQFRKSLFQSGDTQTILGLAGDYFANIDESLQLNPDNEGFLMGGHG